MTLREYLDRSGISSADFAERVGTSRQHLWNLMNGTVPRADLADRIIKASGYAVTLEDLAAAPDTEPAA